MTDTEQVRMLMSGDVDSWNSARSTMDRIDLADADLSRLELPGVDLSGANLRAANLIGCYLPGADLRFADLEGADARGTNLVGADLSNANLRGADLTRSLLRAADLTGADLAGATCIETDFDDAWLERALITGARLLDCKLRRTHMRAADFSGVDPRSEAALRFDLPGSDLQDSDFEDADMTETNLRGVNLTAANLSGADLSNADLTRAQLIGTLIEGSILVGTRVYGTAAWDVQGEPRRQADLRVDSGDGPTMTVDGLRVAQFVHLFMDNPQIREAVDAVARKAVLILGTFGERKFVLEALRESLRAAGYAPIVFDFEKPTTRDLKQTIVLLALMSRFVVVELSDPRSVGAELEAIVPEFRVPIVPIIEADAEPFALFSTYDLPWVLDLHRYTDLESLLEDIRATVIDRAEAKLVELATSRSTDRLR